MFRSHTFGQKGSFKFFEKNPADPDSTSAKSIVHTRSICRFHERFPARKNKLSLSPALPAASMKMGSTKFHRSKSFHLPHINCRQAEARAHFARITACFCEKGIRIGFLFLRLFCFSFVFSSDSLAFPFRIGIPFDPRPEQSGRNSQIPHGSW